MFPMRLVQQASYPLQKSPYSCICFMELRKDYVYFYDSTCHILSWHSMNIFYIYNNHTPIHKSPKAQRRSRHILVLSALFFFAKVQCEEYNQEVGSLFMHGLWDEAGHGRT